MNNNCIFCKIANRKIPSNIIYENDKAVVFKDIHPVAPVHLLIIPKEHIDDFYDVKDSDIYMAIIDTVKKMIEQNNLMSKGYKIEVNGGGAQIIDHLHFHLIAPVAKPQA